MVAGPAQAALECQYYDQALAEAVMIMQIDRTEVTLPPDGSTSCTLRGTIIRSFLGPHPVGTLIETQVPCDGFVQSTGEPAPIEVGPAIYRSVDALAAAPVVELHIAPEGGPAAYGGGVILLDAPTEAPVSRRFCGS